MRYVALLCLVACGSPFETAHHLAPEGGTEASRPEAGKDAARDVRDEAVPPFDAPFDATDAPPPSDAGPDTPVPPPVDAGHDSTVLKESGPPDSGCGSTEMVFTSMWWNASTSFSEATPPECLCGQYTCACLVAGVCNANDGSCTIAGTGQFTVSCPMGYK